MNPRQIRRLMTNPGAYVRFMTTGQTPQGVRPQSPLIALIESIAPRDRLEYVGLVVDERLGYAGSRRFHNAAQALTWLKPAEEVFDSFPAESWRIKSFSAQLDLAALAGCCERAPVAPSAGGRRPPRP